MSCSGNCSQALKSFYSGGQCVVDNVIASIGPALGCYQCQAARIFDENNHADFACIVISRMLLRCKHTTFLCTDPE